MVNILRDGIFILYTYKEAVLFYGITVLGLGIFSIKQITDETMKVGISLTAALVLGSVILCISSYGLVLLSHFLPFLLIPGGYVIFAFSFFILLQSLYMGEIKLLNLPTVGSGLVIFLLLCIRLVFLKYIVLPPYSDSPVHYQIVSGLLHPDLGTNTRISLNSVFTNYYHFGFHSITAWLVSITNLDPADAISLVGQLFLVIGPLSIVFLTNTLTRSNHGAIFAGLLAAIGWHMPAFAVNWGKYPALTSLATMPVTLAFLWSYSQGYIQKNKGIMWGIILTAGIVLLHTRMIICIVLFILCDFLTGKLSFDNQLNSLKSISYSILYIVVLWPFLPILTDFYNGFIIALVMLVLLPFAFQGFPRLATEIFLFTFGIWLFSTAPTLLNKNYPVLFDRQFVAMMLYIPFSIIGGLGLAAITRKDCFTEVSRVILLTVVLGIVTVNFWHNDSVYPNACCNYFQKEDRLVFGWFQKQVSKHTLVLISASNNGDQLVGTDAGIWLTPLLGQPTNKLSFDRRWDSQAEIEKLCQLNTDEVFIYMGGRTFSFDNAQLSQGAWTVPVYNAGKTVIYKISPCP